LLLLPRLQHVLAPFRWILFRRDFGTVYKLRSIAPAVPIQCLTATADAGTRAEIGRLLSLKNAELIKTTFWRPNITIWREKRTASWSNGTSSSRSFSSFFPSAQM
jgi:superfamily II DNA helicase RecQ